MRSLPEKIDLSYCLSEFQLEVLNDVCDGLKRHEIAEKRHKSIGAVNHVINCLYAELDCKNYIDLFKVLYGFAAPPEKRIINTKGYGVRKIIELHLQGLKAAQIAQRTGNSRNYIYNVINSYKAVIRAEKELKDSSKGMIKNELTTVTNSD
ncbi:LurX regulator protein [Dolichospermum phage Dfl-JY23]